MSTVIHKEILPFGRGRPSTIELTPGSKILKTALQNDQIVVWFERPVSANSESPLPTVPVKFVNVPTGAEVPKGFVYVGTVQIDSGLGELVQHQYVEASAPVSVA